MFNFMWVDNYEKRKVGLFEAHWGAVSTVAVNDGDLPFETAVKHRDYRRDDEMDDPEAKWIIVEAYGSKAEAAAGHERWIKTMTSEPLPAELKDCCNAGIAAFGEVLGMNTTFKRKEQSCS